jgi:hypothetical protein
VTLVCGHAGRATALVSLHFMGAWFVTNMPLNIHSARATPGGERGLGKSGSRCPMYY